MKRQTDRAGVYGFPKKTVLKTPAPNANEIIIRVINACGFWGREVGKLAGLDLPLVPVQHQVQHQHLAPHV